MIHKKLISASLAAAFLAGLAINTAGASELSLSYFMGPKHPMNRAVFTPFAKKLAEVSAGKMTVKQYPGGALNSAPPKQYSILLKGVADIAFALPGYTGKLFPVTNTVTIPGVSSLGAAAADANLSLVSRTESLLVVPATIDEATLQDRLAMTDAAAIFKVGRHMAKIKRVLGTLGRVDDATYVERASGVDGRVLAFTDAPDKAPYFSMVLVTKRNAP